MKIGFIGCGKVGTVLARQFVQAGHQVLLSSRHPRELLGLAIELGELASVESPHDVARDGDVIVLSIPYGEIPRLERNVIRHLSGKVVIDTCNPYPERDGEPAREALREGRGSGIWTAEHLPGARVVKAFNTVYYKLLASEAHRPGVPIGIPIASDDPEALDTVVQLVCEAGYGPVVIGGLERAIEFDVGTPPYDSAASSADLEDMFGLRAAA
jgi:predicted dinucleotide-binding enzyme